MDPLGRVSQTCQGLCFFDESGSVTTCFGSRMVWFHGGKRVGHGSLAGQIIDPWLGFFPWICNKRPANFWVAIYYLRRIDFAGKKACSYRFLAFLFQTKTVTMEEKYDKFRIVGFLGSHSKYQHGLKALKNAPRWVIFFTWNQHLDATVLYLKLTIVVA